MDLLHSFSISSHYSRFTFLFAFFFLVTIPSANSQCECANRCDIPPPFVSKISITDAGYWKVITSNGIPNHPIGIFPLIPCGRPDAMREQDYTFVIPAYSSKGIRWRESKVFELPTPPFRGEPQVSFGVAVNGVQFDPAAAEWHDDGIGEAKLWAKDPLTHPHMETDLDCNNGHVQPDGGYHYHGFPHALHEQIEWQQEQRERENDNMPKRSEIVLLGWAFDGNPIYGETCGTENSSILRPRSGYRLRTGGRHAYYSDDDSSSVPPLSGHARGVFVNDYEYNSALTPGDLQLDRCNGHTAPTPEFPDGVYHYHILKKSTTGPDYGFPYIGRCYRLFNYLRGPDVFPPTGRG